MSVNLITWPLGILACDSCGTILKPDLGSSSAHLEWRCSTCQRWWEQSGLTLLSGHATAASSDLIGESQAFFNTHALTGDEGSVPDPFILHMEHIANYDYVARSVALATDLGARTVVEFGCGDGRTLRALHENDPSMRLVGVDVAREKLIQAENAFQFQGYHPTFRNVALIQCQGDVVPIARDSADLVLILHVLHHAGDLALVSEAARILRPGGTMFVVDISDTNPLVTITRIIWKYLPSIVRRQFNREYNVNGEAPIVQLVNPVILENFALRRNFRLSTSEDDGLFAFLFCYLLIAAPMFRRPFALHLLRCLRATERFLIRRTCARHWAAGIARIWTLAE
jgi:SAM-dependent methyltransferase